MNHLQLAGLIMAVASLIGCIAPDDPRRVTLMDTMIVWPRSPPGTYFFDFKYMDVGGPADMRYESEVKRRFHEVEKFLTLHHMIPSACTQGIVVVGSGDGEGGGGWAKFRCR